MSSGYPKGTILTGLSGCGKVYPSRRPLVSIATAVFVLFGGKIPSTPLTEKYAGLEQKNQEKQERIHELRQQNQQAQSNLEHYRAASLEQRLADQQRHEQQQKQLEQTIQNVNQELAQVQSERMVFQKNSQEADFENENLRTQLDTIGAQHETITIRLNDTLNELARKTQDQQHWQKQYQGLSEKWDTQNKLLIELQTQHAVLSQHLLILKAELKEISEQNKVLGHEKWILGQEKAQLYGQLKQLSSAIT